MCYDMRQTQTVKIVYMNENMNEIVCLLFHAETIEKQ